MDIVFISLASLLWGLMALLVWGFTKLEPAVKDRP